MSWYIFKNGNDCLRCNNTGTIPVLTYQCPVGNTPQLIETAYVCNCGHGKDWKDKKVVEYVDEITGKRKNREKEIICSQRFDDVFSELQFPWSEEIMKSREPWVDYIEIYTKYKILTQREFKITGEPKIVMHEIN